MNTFPRTGFNGYTSKTFTFKSTPEGGSISVDVAYPEETDGSPSTVLIHYHGGFLIVGDRYSFLPYWLVHACASRKWIFVTPEYRLIPETTAHAALEDAVDAYEWTRSSLPDLLGHPVGSVLLAGSSAGGYLALSTASAVVEKPAALLLIYGLHDPAGLDIRLQGSISLEAAIETAPVLREFPKRKQNEDREIISAYALPADPAEDRRFSLASALHIDALFPDYITGVDGLSREMAKRGIEAIPEDHHRLFPLSFGNLSNIPRTMLLHGLNDSAVPVECSVQAEKKLRAAGSEVFTEFPEDGEHGFDVRVGNLDVEGAGGDGITAVESLRNVIRFLHSSVTNEASA